MRWSERQRAMLLEMGIRMWAPEPALEDGAVHEADAEKRAQAAAEARIGAAGSAVAGVGAESRVGVGAGVEAGVGTGSVSGAQADARPRNGSARRPDAVVAARVVEQPGAVANVADAAPVLELLRADWLIVGEPFGSADEAQGGAEQQTLLVNMLHAIGVALDAPGPAKRASFLPIPSAPAPALAKAFQAVQPRCVLVLGRAAAQAFLNADEPLGRLRERVHEHSGVPVVVTFSLAYLLRHPAEKAKAWADLCKAVGLLAEPRPCAAMKRLS